MTNERRGTVRQAANGTWYFVVDVGAGERKQTKKRGFPTRRAAQAAVTETLNRLQDRTYVAPKRQTLGVVLTDTWLPAIEHSVRVSTYESYARNIRLHIARGPIGQGQLQALQPSALNQHFALLLRGDETHRPVSARSLHYVATILHRALRDAVRWQALARNPVDAADPPRPGAKPEMRTWTRAELGKFRAHIADDRLAGAWWLLCTTGMRRGEVLGMRWADVDLDAGVARITRTLIAPGVQRKSDPGIAWGTPKTAKGRRSVALDRATVATLRTHRARQLEERLAMGPGDQDQDLIVCQVDGRPVHP